MATAFPRFTFPLVMKTKSSYATIESTEEISSTKTSSHTTTLIRTVCFVMTTKCWKMAVVAALARQEDSVFPITGAFGTMPTMTVLNGGRECYPKKLYRWAIISIKCCKYFALVNDSSSLE